MRQQRPHGFSKAPPQYCYTGIRYQHKFLGTLTFKPQRCGHGVGESTASLVSSSPTSAPVEREFETLTVFPAGHAPRIPVLSTASKRAEKEVASSQYNTSISPEKDRTPRKSMTGPEKRKQKWEAMGWLEGTLLGKTQEPDLEVCFL